MSFRDGSLLQIFELGLEHLRQLMGSATNDLNERLRDLCLQLIVKCLAFDFLGTQPDESSEDSGTIQVRRPRRSKRAVGSHTSQVPSSWKAPIEDPATTELMFKLYEVGSVDLVIRRS